MAIHIARIKPMLVNNVGNIVNKNDATIKQVATANTELRVYQNVEGYAPNAINYPTIENYLWVEDSEGYSLIHMDQTFIITKQ